MKNDNQYVDKQKCEAEGFVRTSKGVYKLSALEKAYSRGRLRYGSKRFGEDDRLKAGQRLAVDYAVGRFDMLGSGWIKDKIDKGGNADLSSRLIECRSRYLSAIKHIPREFWAVVRLVCIEGRLPVFDDEKSLRKRYEKAYLCYCDLCRGLDRLIEFYTTRKPEE